MIEGSLFLTYLCSNCDQWHGQYVAPLEPSGDVARAAHIIGEALVGHGDATAYGAILVWGTPEAGHLASIFGDGPLLRATAAPTTSPAELVTILDHFARYDIALERLAECGTQTLYADSSWTRVLNDITGGATTEARSTPEGKTMTSAEIRKLMGAG